MRNLASAAVVALPLAVPFGFTPASSATNEQAITSLPSGALPISDYYNQSVYDNQDNKVGDVNDLLVDKDGRIGAAIVGVGGFLGAGERRGSLQRAQADREERQALPGDGHHQRGAQ
jgi:PRC-barrel domain